MHYGPYQGAKKGKQVASSTKWRLGDNIVLRLMECLTPAVSFDLFMDNYFTSFRLFVCLPTLDLTIFEREVCSTKIGYANTLPSEINSWKKKNVATLNSAAHIKQKRCSLCAGAQPEIFQGRGGFVKLGYFDKYPQKIFKKNSPAGENFEFFSLRYS